MTVDDLLQENPDTQKEAWMAHSREAPVKVH